MNKKEIKDVQQIVNVAFKLENGEPAKLGDVAGAVNKVLSWEGLNNEGKPENKTFGIRTSFDTLVIKPLKEYYMKNLQGNKEKIVPPKTLKGLLKVAESTRYKTKTSNNKIKCLVNFQNCLRNAIYNIENSEVGKDIKNVKNMRKNGVIKGYVKNYKDNEKAENTLNKTKELGKNRKALMGVHLLLVDIKFTDKINANELKDEEQTIQSLLKTLYKSKKENRWDEPEKCFKNAVEYCKKYGGERFLKNYKV